MFVTKALPLTVIMHDAGDRPADPAQPQYPLHRSPVSVKSRQPHRRSFVLSASPSRTPPPVPRQAAHRSLGIALAVAPAFSPRSRAWLFAWDPEARRSADLVIGMHAAGASLLAAAGALSRPRCQSRQRRRAGAPDRSPLPRSSSDPYTRVSFMHGASRQVNEVPVAAHGPSRMLGPRDVVAVKAPMLVHDGPRTDLGRSEQAYARL
ncbi:hypothetical protein AURDEDRAFT_172386 [Auricularia subglabra TFB-10046 SS5]|nr:hypothetical protein AURDEDRAFT_172386 [Auricularia subglabra TFB-10046 SS5]